MTGLGGECDITLAEGSVVGAPILSATLKVVRFSHDLAPARSCRLVYVRDAPVAVCLRVSRASSYPNPRGLLHNACWCSSPLCRGGTKLQRSCYD